MHVRLVHVRVHSRDPRVEVRPGDEVVEGADGRPAPHLVVERAVGDAAVGPCRRQAEVPAEDERHLELRVPLGARDLLGVLELVEGERDRLVPDGLHRLAEDLLLETSRDVRRDRIERRVLHEELVQLLGARGEHRPLLEHLQVDAHLEHVGGRGHRHVAVRRLRQLLAHNVARARLPAHLVDRAGHDEVSTHGVRRRRRLRAADAAARAHAHAHAGLLGDAVALGQDHRQQHGHVPVVGVATAVALDRDVVAHGHARGERRLLGSHEPLRQQLRHNVRRRWVHRKRRQLGARHLEDDLVAADGAARCTALEASHAIPHDPRGQLHEGRRLHHAHAALEEELDAARLKKLVSRRVDQVDGEWTVGQRRLDLVEPCGHNVQRQPARAERAEHAVLPRRDHQVGRRDALGHRARVQRVLDAVLLHERRRAQAEHRPRHRAHEARAATRQVNHNVALRVGQRAAKRRSVGRAHLGASGRRQRRGHGGRRGARHNADPQVGGRVHAQLVDEEEAVGDDGDAAARTLDLLDVDLALEHLVLGDELPAVLPLGDALVVLEARVGHAVGEALVDAEELHGLVHGLDAQGAWHDRVTPEVAAEEPVARVDGLEAVRVALAMHAAVGDEADLVEVAALRRAPLQRVRTRNLGEDARLLGGEGVHLRLRGGVLGHQVPRGRRLAAVEADLLLEDLRDEPAEGGVNLVEGLATVDGELGLELLHAHLAEHRVAGRCRLVADRLAAQVDVAQQLGGRVEVAEEDVVAVACARERERRLVPGRQHAAGLQRDLHQDRVGHEVGARRALEEPRVGGAVELGDHRPRAGVAVDVVPLVVAGVGLHARDRDHARGERQVEGGRAARGAHVEARVLGAEALREAVAHELAHVDPRERQHARRVVGVVGVAREGHEGDGPRRVRGRAEAGRGVAVLAGERVPRQRVAAHGRLAPLHELSGRQRRAEAGVRTAQVEPARRIP